MSGNTGAFFYNFVIFAFFLASRIMRRGRTWKEKKTSGNPQLPP